MPRWLVRPGWRLGWTEDIKIKVEEESWILRRKWSIMKRAGIPISRVPSTSKLN
jgi:hypothetical protein